MRRDGGMQEKRLACLNRTKLSDIKSVIHTVPGPRGNPRRHRGAGRDIRYLSKSDQTDVERFRIRR